MAGAMRRTLLDEDLLEWEAYVTGGQPGTPLAARIFFVCLTDPFARPRWVRHDSGDVATAERELREMEEERLLSLLTEARPLD